jgi:hypothetical protein
MSAETPDNNINSVTPVSRRTFIGTTAPAVCAQRAPM